MGHQVDLIHLEFRDAAGRPVDAGEIGAAAVSLCVLRILKENVLCSIATVTRSGRAHINTAHFCYSDDVVLYFLSHPNAQHSRNLQRRPSAAVTVFSSEQRWGRPGRGVQMFGSCRAAVGALNREAERLYASRFSPYRRWKTAASRTGDGRDYRFYRFEVSSLKLMDETIIGDGVFASAMIDRRRR